MTYFKKLKKKLAEYLLKDEIKALNRKVQEEIEKYQFSSKNADNQALAHSNERNKLLNIDYACKVIISKYSPIVDINEEYGGLYDFILSEKPDTLTGDAFLAEIHTVAKNDAFNLLLNLLIREQILAIAKGNDDGIPQTLEQINFQKATLNSFEIIRNSLDTLESIYKERNEPEEQFDEHGILEE